MTPLPNAESVARVPESNMDHDEQPTFAATSTADQNSPIDTPKNNGVVTGGGGGGIELNMLLESDRLKSFEDWPVTFIEPRDMAAAGFYQKEKNKDLVKCPYCGIEIGEWVRGDEPFHVHKTLTPRCPFVEQKNENNNLETRQEDSRSTGEDTCGPYGMASVNSTRRAPAPEVERVAGNENNESLNYNPSETPLFPQYTSYDARLKSFQNWPGEIPADLLSMAGFVYSRVEDRTYCFHCGGILRNWDAYDSVWVEHAHWFPKCKFMLKMRGQKFIDDARATKLRGLAQTQQEMKNAIEMIREMVSANDEDKVSPKNCKDSSSEGSKSIDVSVNIEDVPESSSNRDETRRMCLICTIEERNTVLLPCYHVVACTKCVHKLTNCCVCREKIIYRRRIYIP